MRQEVYADLLFLINFSMDFLCLYLTARFLRLRIRPALITLAAAIGGVYSVVSLFLPFGRLLTALIDFSVCALLCGVTYFSKTKKPRQFAKEIFVYILVSMALGGIMTALFNLLNKLDLPLQSGGDSISSWLFLLLAIVSGAAAMSSGNILRRMAARKIMNVRIVFDRKSVAFSGMTDTGNVLRDPASGKPVIITDIRATLPILPAEVVEAVVSGKLDSIPSLPARYAGRIRIIPSVTISGSRLIIGIVPDKIILSGEHGDKDVTAIFAPVKISSLPEGCAAIIPGELNT